MTERKPLPTSAARHQTQPGTSEVLVRAHQQGHGRLHVSRWVLSDGRILITDRQFFGRSISSGIRMQYLNDNVDDVNFNRGLSLSIPIFLELSNYHRVLFHTIPIFLSNLPFLNGFPIFLYSFPIGFVLGYYSQWPPYPSEAVNRVATLIIQSSLRFGYSPVDRVATWAARPSWQLAPQRLCGASWSRWWRSNGP